MLSGATGHPRTMAWWSENQDAWEACRTDCQSPEKAMRQYVDWLKELPGRPVFVAYPAAYDFMFVYWYLMRFAGESPFSHSALDIKTLAMAMMKTSYRDATKRNMPKNWFDRKPHTHIALDDAIEQGALRSSATCSRPYHLEARRGCISNQSAACHVPRSSRPEPRETRRATTFLLRCCK